MSDAMFIKLIPFALVAMGAFLLVTRRNPWPAGIAGSTYPLRWLRGMGAFFILVAIVFWLLDLSGRLAVAQ